MIDGKYLDRLEMLVKLKKMPAVVNDGLKFKLISAQCPEVFRKIRATISSNPLGLTGHIEGDQWRVMNALGEKADRELKAIDKELDDTGKLMADTPTKKALIDHIAAVEDERAAQHQ